MVSAAARCSSSGCSKPANFANGEGVSCKYVCLQTILIDSRVVKARWYLVMLPGNPYLGLCNAIPNLEFLCVFD